MGKSELATLLQVRRSGIAPGYLLIGLWTLAMISVPILEWTMGPGGRTWGVIAGVLLQVLASVVALLAVWPAWAMLRMALIVLPAAWLVEFVGSHTGFPFGAYHYTSDLQPQIGGVPLLVPLAWFMMLPAAWAAAQLLVRRRQGATAGIRFAAAAALSFTAWDLFLDPQMVGWGYWVWSEPSGYFGIPWSNYAGWLLCSFVITWLVFSDERTTPALPERPLLVIYTISWALQTIGLAFFWDMAGPAAAGFVAMGVIVVLAWRAHLSPAGFRASAGEANQAADV